ncbi:AAA family ATPase [Aestuariivirga sp.]|uniref:AAA family ATPase n=1 Tax=Aestuariivirga sp. TaxID=2650926 RepID=UPI003BAC5EDE
MLRTIAIKNFKSFSDSEAVEISKHWTVVVGKNNSGKSSFLRAMRIFQISNEPYRGIKQRKDRPRNPSSSFRFQISISGPALRRYLANRDLFFPFGGPQGSMPGNRTEQFNRLLAEGSIIVDGLTPSPGNVSVTSVMDDSGTLMYPCDRYDFFRIEPETGQAVYHQIPTDPSALISTVLSDLYGSETYFFNAERMHIGISKIDNVSHLESDANNLAQVLNKLRENQHRYEKFVTLVAEVFPEITDIVPSVINSGVVEIKLSTAPREDEREDLLISLSASGTGVSQVLAIIYVVLNSDEPKLIVIDEPNSFLHPGAAKQLIRILKRFPQHQFVVSTHSPEIISEISPETLLVVRWTPSGSIVARVDEGLDGLKETLKEIGTQFSDVFGLDGVIYVEGETEVDCFALILESRGKELSRGVEFVKIGDPDKLTGSEATSFIRSYERLLSAVGVIPPVVAFCRDRETLTATQIDDLRRELGSKLRLLPRRCFENYLLHTEAIYSLLREKGLQVSKDNVADWISSNSDAKIYWKENSEIPEPFSERWLKEIDGAKFIKRLVSSLSESVWEYRKISDGTLLTKWLLANDPDHLSEVSDFVIELASLDAPAE